ncbi:ribonuclease H-like domain-containing protein [Tanacetum coccineum]
MPKLNTGVLLTLWPRLHGFVIYFASYILLYRSPPLSTVSVIYMSANPVQHQWMKHIKIDIHFVFDMVTAGQVIVLHVPSRYQYDDIFTKGLPSALREGISALMKCTFSIRQLEYDTVPDTLDEYFPLATKGRLYSWDCSSRALMGNYYGLRCCAWMVAFPISGTSVTFEYDGKAEE